MNVFMQLKLFNREGSLERVLGVVRLRGFQISEMAAHQHGDSDTLDVTLKLTGTRESDNLKQQLDKLYDVERVEMFIMAPVKSAVMSNFSRQPVAAAG